MPVYFGDSYISSFKERVIYDSCSHPNVPFTPLYVQAAKIRKEIAEKKQSAPRPGFTRHRGNLSRRGRTIISCVYSDRKKKRGARARVYDQYTAINTASPFIVPIAISDFFLTAASRQSLYCILWGLLFNKNDDETSRASILIYNAGYILEKFRGKNMP